MRWAENCWFPPSTVRKPTCVFRRGKTPSDVGLTEAELAAAECDIRHDAPATVLGDCAYQYVPGMAQSLVPDAYTFPVVWCPSWQ